jgi:hypothetical protein
MLVICRIERYACSSPLRRVRIQLLRPTGSPGDVISRPSPVKGDRPGHNSDRCEPDPQHVAGDWASRIYRLATAAVVGMVVMVGLSGCGSDQPAGLPLFVKFENRTPGAITILHQRASDPEVVVVPTLAAGKVWGDYINTHGNILNLCKDGDYIARDASGNLVSRHDDMGCGSWVIATEPIPVSITNSTDQPLSVDVSTRAISGPASVVRVVTDLKPHATFTGSLGDLGDPNDLCLGGALTATDDAGHKVATEDLSDCGRWVWDIVSTQPAGS